MGSLVASIQTALLFAAAPYPELRAVLDRSEWLRKQLGIGPLAPADRKR
jgi:hypothetical protein